ncbi:MAG: hypothetical protein KF745_09440 [Phycisphaeraceae bacterium]|nr:hypothetical protein [Phycisphaeraceae bacterium]
MSAKACIALLITASAAMADSVDVRRAMSELDMSSPLSPLHAPALLNNPAQANPEPRGGGAEKSPLSPETVAPAMDQPRLGLLAESMWRDAGSPQPVHIEAVPPTPRDQLVVVPLPAPAALTGIGLVGVILLRRRVLR